jgi:sortase A
MAEPSNASGSSGTGVANEPRLGKFDRPSAPLDWRFWVGGLGKVLIASGLLMFGFVGYQLWGTGIETARAQNQLEDEFTELLDGVASTSVANSPVTTTPATTMPVASIPVTSDPTTSPPTTAVPVADQNLPEITDGDAIARLEIPAIGVDSIVVAGVAKSDLKKGPGHYPDTPLPGQLGNAAIAGHRTTYGQPFYDVDQLQPGDEIVATTPAGRFVYRVTGQQIVSPSDYEVVATTDPTMSTLTLTSCHPRWTARERIVITSELDITQSDPVGEAVLNYGREPGPTNDPDAGGSPTATTTLDGTEATDDTVVEPVDDRPTDDGIADAFAESWFSDPSANGQVGLWGALLTLIAAWSYALSRKVKRDWVGALVGLVPFVVALYFFFQNVNRLLPPNL